VTWLSVSPSLAESCPVDAFDADVFIYAASPRHTLGRRVLGLLREPGRDPAIPAGIGSVLLLPELLSKPTREGVEHEATALAAVLARLDLLPVDEPQPAWPWVLARCTG